MTERMQIFKCLVCGNMVEVTHPGGGILACCNRPMTLFSENTTDTDLEQHVPQVQIVNDGYIVNVGSVAHPMEEDHYIQWVELVARNKSYTQFLAPDDLPQVKFKTDAKDVYARVYCNLHGLWKG